MLIRAQEMSRKCTPVLFLYTKRLSPNRKPVYELHAFVLTIPEETLNEMLLKMSEPKPQKE